MIMILQYIMFVQKLFIFKYIGRTEKKKEILMQVFSVFVPEFMCTRPLSTAVCSLEVTPVDLRGFLVLYTCFYTSPMTYCFWLFSLNKCYLFCSLEEVAVLKSVVQQEQFQSKLLNFVGDWLKVGLMWLEKLLSKALAKRIDMLSIWPIAFPEVCF